MKYEDNPNLNIVIGNPGSGKSTFLASLLKWGVEEAAWDAHDFAICSLTRAAARVIGMKADIPHDNVGTMHSFAYKALNKPQIAETKSGVQNWNEYISKKGLVWAQLSKAKFGGDIEELDVPQEAVEASGDGDLIYAHYQMLRAKMTPREEWPSNVRQMAQEWERWKEGEHLLDFNDLIERAYLDKAALPDNYRALFIDEAQDLTALMWQLTKYWCEDIEWPVIVGDPKQALYIFAGATPDELFNPLVPDERRSVLYQSYRVPRAVHKEAIRVISRMWDYRDVEYLPRDYEGEVRRLSATYREPTALIRDIERQIANGKKVMVLASCSYLLKDTENALRKAAIPFHNPYRLWNAAWNPIGPGRGIRAYERVLAYRAYADSNPERDFIFTYDELQRFSDVLKATAFAERGGKTKALRELSREERYVHLQLEQLDDIFGVENSISVADGDYDWLLANALPDKRKVLEYPVSLAKRHGSKILTEIPQVVLGTIHSCKGSESDVVYIYPDLAKAGYAEWCDSKKRNSILMLMYVAITRARETVVKLSPGGSYYATI